MNNKMIVVRAFISLGILAAMVLSGTSCKDDPTKKEIFIKSLSRQWASSTIGTQFNGEDVNGVFDDFTITFGKKSTYTTTDGNKPVWAASGTYTLKETKTATGFSILRDDGVEITVDQLTDVKLVLKFPYTKEGGRSASVSGGYVFDLEPVN